MISEWLGIATVSQGDVISDSNHFGGLGGFTINSKTMFTIIWIAVLFVIWCHTPFFDPILSLFTRLLKPFFFRFRRNFGRGILKYLIFGSEGTIFFFIIIFVFIFLSSFIILFLFI